MAGNQRGKRCHATRAKMFGPRIFSTMAFLLYITHGYGLEGDDSGFRQIYKHETQQTLQQADHSRTAEELEAGKSSAVSNGGALTLVNGSPFNWTLNGQSSYQMNIWNWPTIEMGHAAKIYVEFGTTPNPQDDAGVAYFDIRGTPNWFSILAQRTSDFELTVSLGGISTEQSPQGSEVDLGFRHDASVNWIMSTDSAGRWWSNSGNYTDWMQQSMGTLGNRTLKHICMPGSHDAGMSIFRPGTIGAHFANTQTQYLDFYQQLMAGSRFFDLRPVISNGQWVSGHYGTLKNHADAIWLGGNGQSLAETIEQINNFTSEYHELIIINLSHTLDTDNRYKDLSQEQWNGLFDTLKGINNRYSVINPGDTDFTNKVLGDFITDRASVFIIAQLPSGISLGNYADQGFFSGPNFPFYDSYSNTNNQPMMKMDQLAKLKANRNIVAAQSDRKDRFHILSWTLTQQPEDVLNFDRAIMNMAAAAFDDLISEGWNAFTPESFPNVLYVDALGIRDKSVVFPYSKPRSVAVNHDIAALAIAINNGIAGRNRYIIGE